MSRLLVLLQKIHSRSVRSLLESTWPIELDIVPDDLESHTGNGTKKERKRKGKEEGKLVA